MTNPENYSEIREMYKSLKYKKEQYYLSQRLINGHTRWIESRGKEISRDHSLFSVVKVISPMGGIHTLLARMDKMPPYLMTTIAGESWILVYDSDSPMTIKIKQFMAMYGIVDITMRMLLIPELKRIMGFPSAYKLIGTQTEQKKYIGNAVEVNMAKAMCLVLAESIKNHQSSIKN